MTDYVTIYNDSPDDDEYWEFHVDYVPRSDLFHFVFYDKKERRDGDGWFMTRERAITMAKAILIACEEE